MSQICQNKTGLSNLPLVDVAAFLTTRDVCALTSTCSELARPILMVHVSTPERDISIGEARRLVSQLCLGAVESLEVNGKRKGGMNLLIALSEKAEELVRLSSVRINAAAETGNFLCAVLKLSAFLRKNQLTRIHLSGFRRVAHVIEFTVHHRESLRDLKVDYFVSGHEKDVTLPLFPKLESLVFDVADVVDFPISQALSVLGAIENPKNVTAIYMPHMQISGDAGQTRELIERIKLFSNASQLVVRFRRLPLGVAEVIALREAFPALGAVCISDHFVVMLKEWASWWPSQKSIWESPDRITGLSVFREQIDFESLGTSATREWLKLSREQKNLWSKCIAQRVIELFPLN